MSISLFLGPSPGSWRSWCQRRSLERCCSAPSPWRRAAFGSAPGDAYGRLGRQPCRPRVFLAATTTANGGIHIA